MKSFHLAIHHIVWTVIQVLQVGGIFILVYDSMISSEQPQLKTKCEVIWVKLEITGSCPLLISAYYKHNEDDQESLLKLRTEIIQSKSKGKVWILGDFNLPKLDWTNETPSFKSTCSRTLVYDIFLEILDDFNLVQMTKDSTRHKNVLDLFLTSSLA